MILTQMKQGLDQGLCCCEDRAKFKIVLLTGGRQHIDSEATERALLYRIIFSTDAVDERLCNDSVMIPTSNDCEIVILYCIDKPMRIVNAS